MNMYDYYLRVKSDNPISIVLELMKYNKYYAHELCYTITLPKSREVKEALKHWDFGYSGRGKQGVVLTRDEECIPMYHKNWRSMYTLEMSDGYYLSSPDMYKFLHREVGAKAPAWDMQLGHKFC